MGFGKTIEAGLCLLELRYRLGPTRRLVVPPGLIPQWEEELKEPFGLGFTVIDNATGLARTQTTLPAGLSPLELPSAQVIASIELPGEGRDPAPRALHVGVLEPARPLCAPGDAGKGG